jgi:hypothetical protein
MFVELLVFRATSDKGKRIKIENLIKLGLEMTLKWKNETRWKIG